MSQFERPKLSLALLGAVSAVEVELAFFDELPDEPQPEASRTKAAIRSAAGHTVLVKICTPSTAIVLQSTPRAQDRSRGIA
jgi:hypothetical protein